MNSEVQIYIIRDYDSETTTGSTGTFAHSAQKAQRKKVQAKLDSAKYIFWKLFSKLLFSKINPLTLTLQFIKKVMEDMKANIVYQKVHRRTVQESSCHFQCWPAMVLSAQDLATTGLLHPKNDIKAINVWEMAIFFAGD